MRPPLIGPGSPSRLQWQGRPCGEAGCATIMCGARGSRLAGSIGASYCTPEKQEAHQSADRPGMPIPAGKPKKPILPSYPFWPRRWLHYITTGGYIHPAKLLSHCRAREQLDPRPDDMTVRPPQPFLDHIPSRPWAVESNNGRCV